MNWPKFN